MKERVGQTLGRKEAHGLMISTFTRWGWISSSVSMRRWDEGELFAVDDTDQLALLKG
ncbi:hypothetical protein [Shigella flexneri]|uniref:hypothetical protein n=1 Tax=Shigella flexneri TaxID=623 RepID=UPI0020CF55DA|nr:hypothetical protein [Shigella flexneri]